MGLGVQGMAEEQPIERRRNSRRWERDLGERGRKGIRPRSLSFTAPGSAAFALSSHFSDVTAGRAWQGTAYLPAFRRSARSA
jgi:hypothetical protein